jgi:uncharacterized membrane protein YgdD (TMEM256/DUF423 family)
MVMVGAVLGALAVAAGAFGAHALRGRITPEHLAVWETAARYHLVHAVLLVFIGWALPAPRNLVPFALIACGTVIFAGTLYALVLSGLRWLGAITPLGGLALIAGWLALAWAVWSSR